MLNPGDDRICINARNTDILTNKSLQLQSPQAIQLQKSQKSGGVR